jgi:hypothetical protein
LSKFIVIKNKDVMESPGDFLLESGYYKSYSLFMANNNDIGILDTLVLTSADSIDILDEYLNIFSEPIMLRMDYASLSGGKYIGGIPVYTISALKEICLFLFDNGYIPVLQPYPDRFKNLYAINCLLTNKNYELTIELVGNGFDAADLRLGLTSPHEVIVYDYNNWKVLSRNIMSSDEYFNSKLKRELYTGKMEVYIKYVNNENKLLKNIDTLKEDNIRKLNDDYIPATKDIIDEATFLSNIMKMKIIPFLPFSQDYIISFSVLENKNFVLWDIYGKWYIR